MSLLCLNPWNLVPLLGGNYRFFIYLSRRYSTITFFLLSFFPHGDVIGNFYLVFATVFLSFFLSLFTGEKVDFPWGPSSKCQLLDGCGFILFPNPVSALVRSQFVCDSWWSQAPSDEWWMGPGGTTLPLILLILRDFCKLKILRTDSCLQLLPAVNLAEVVGIQFPFSKYSGTTANLLYILPLHPLWHSILNYLSLKIVS